MSGFVCVVRTDGVAVPAETIEQLTASLSYRGPDRQTMRCVDAAALGHALLSIDPLFDGDRQPLTCDGHTWIAADARIDDRDYRAMSDAAYLLRAFQRYGSACLDRLLGDFAFAIWDSRSRQLVAACDHFGVRPLFYAHADPWLAVGSDVSMLRGVPGVSSTLDDQAVADFLVCGYKLDRAATTFRDIRRVPPAHVLTWSSGAGVRVRRYWELPIEEPAYRNDAEHAECLRSLVDTAVADRIRRQPVSIFLSGGLDSNVLAATAARQHGRDAADAVHAFTVVHERLFRDPEGPAAKQAAAALGIPWSGYALDGARDWEGFSWPATPEPFLVPLDGGARQRCYADAAAHSRITLDGEGPDNALTYEWRSYLQYLARGRRWRRLASDAVSFATHHRRVPLLPTVPRLFAATLRRRARNSALPRWISRELVAQYDLVDRYRHAMAMPSSVHPTRPRAWASFHLPVWQTLFDTADPAYALVPFDSAFPFLDVRLVRFLLRTPVIPWGRAKYALRYAYRGALPDAVRRRPKTPLAAFPLVEKVRRDGMPEAVRSPQLDRYGSPALIHSEDDVEQVEASLRFVAFSRWLAHLPVAQPTVTR